MTNKTKKPAEKVKLCERISRKLSYILKYGAEQEGLEIDIEGFASFDELMCLPHFSSFTRDQVLDVIENDRTQKTNRYRFYNEKRPGIYVRMCSKPNFSGNAASIYHEGTRVKRLFEQAVEFICDNIMWPEYRSLMLQIDNFIVIEELITRLRRQGRLNNKTLSVMLVPCLNKLNFDGCLLTGNTLKMIGNNCITLRNLVLRNHPYVITDSSLKELIKNLSHLESLNLAHCHHLTDSSIDSIIQYLPNIRRVNLSFIYKLTTAALVRLTSACDYLEYLDIYGLTIKSKSTEADFNQLLRLSKEKEITIVNEQIPSSVQFN